MQYYVYILNSVHYPEKFYIGFTEDIESRLSLHNSGGSVYTSKYRPWNITMYSVFLNKEIALNFEKYLKTHSGRAFASKHFSTFKAV